MNCPHCGEASLVEKLTKQGVLIDQCERCRGIWLDRGEIYLLSANPKKLEASLARTAADRHPSERRCPRCASVLEAGPLLDASLEVDYCPQCDGIWFDGDELPRALELDRQMLDLDLDPMAQRRDPERHQLTVQAERDDRARLRMAAVAAGMLPLPNLLLRSAGVLLFLYAIVGAVLIALVEFGLLAATPALILGVAIVAVQYVLSPWIMDLSLRWLYRFSWISAEQLPAHLRQFVADVCDRQRIRFPSFGLIHDSAPNAFTYGHTPNNMRIVLTRGILELLEPEEVEAVVAHEIGHGKHWDMALMTMAQLVPLLLYFTYRTLIQVKSRGRDKSASARLAIAIGAYVLYVISEYAVLWFSRCREYYADRFSGEVSGRPNALASALVKIGYGLAAGGKPAAEQAEESAAAGRLEALSAMGIFDAGHARSLVMAAAGPEASAGAISKENLKSAMQWDLWNPWAKFYELNSTHPLIANRLSYLADQAAHLGQEPYIVFDRRQPESYWDDFLVDLGAMALPILVPAAVGLAWLMLGMPSAQAGAWIGWLVSALGIGLVLRIAYEYRGEFFAPLSVAGLLHKVKVSNVRPVPARLRGTIIGKGVPGLIWSEDFVIRDATGILFLDYRQPLRIWEWLFGLLRAGEYIGQEVTVTGWFRRAPVPYLEIKSLEVDGRVSHCYAYYAKLAFALLLAVGGMAFSVAALIGAV